MCCANIGMAVTLSRDAVESGNENVTSAIRELAKFPHKWDDTGRCEHHKDNRCAIYDHRPDICNIARTWWKHFRHMKRTEFFELNKSLCDSMKPNDD